jgi:hypothetical protein
MSAAKPVVFVTRKLPEAIEERLTRDYRARLNPDDRRLGAAELIDGCAGADAVLTCARPRPGQPIWSSACPRA